MEIQFICPECKETELEVTEKVLCSSIIEHIYPDGDYDIKCSEPIFDDSTIIVNFKCSNCGYILTKNGRTIDNNKDLLEFCLDRMKELEYISHKYIDDNAKK
jgi:predicted RNA-binding Zn-ribbon protein involved in translation (DUF1610 family)